MNTYDNSDNLCDNMLVLCGTNNSTACYLDAMEDQINSINYTIVDDVAALSVTLGQP